MEEKVFFTNTDGLRLCGVLIKPQKETQKCVVLCHGITVDKDEDGIYTKLARKLADVGFAAFRFDFRGHGESEGNSTDMTVKGEERDLEAAIEWLKNKGYKKFGIVGASFGGGATSLFTSKHQDIVFAFSVWNAVVDYSSLINPILPWQKKRWGKPAFDRVENNGFTTLGSGFKVGKGLMYEIKNLKPWEELLKVKIPVLFVHGDRDTYVPYDDSVKYSKMLTNAQLVTVKGAEHGFHDRKEDSELADKVTVDFFLENL